MALVLINYSLFQVVVQWKWNQNSEESKEESKEELDEESKEISKEGKDSTVYFFKIMKRSLGEKIRNQEPKLAESISLANQLIN